MTELLPNQIAQFYKIKTPFAWMVSQGFGSNGFIPDNLPNGQPNTNQISLYQYFGWLGHPALDFATPNGTKIEMPFNGSIWKFKNYDGNKQMPWSISVIPDDVFEHEGIKFRLKINYVHVQSCNFGDGDHVDKGIIIGETDNTGGIPLKIYSNNPHTHYEWEPQYFNGYQFNADTLNGYNGMVKPVFEGYVIDIQKFEGLVVKKKSAKECHLVQGGQRHWFPNQFSFWREDRAFSEVSVLNDDEVDAIPLGEQIKDLRPEVKKEITNLYPKLIL
jgi:murein DD-endopeptidase MepM/ murein hydrolase activator NlpD